MILKEFVGLYKSQDFLIEGGIDYTKNLLRKNEEDDTYKRDYEKELAQQNQNAEDLEQTEEMTNQDVPVANEDNVTSIENAQEENANNEVQDKKENSDIDKGNE